MSVCDYAAKKAVQHKKTPFACPGFHKYRERPVSQSQKLSTAATVWTSELLSTTKGLPIRDSGRTDAAMLSTAFAKL